MLMALRRVIRSAYIKLHLPIYRYLSEVERSTHDVRRALDAILEANNDTTQNDTPQYDEMAELRLILFQLTERLDYTQAMFARELSKTNAQVSNLRLTETLNS